MFLLEQLDTDWCNLWPSGPTAQLSIRVSTQSVDVSWFHEHTAVLQTEGYVKHAMSCESFDNCERHHFTYLALHTITSQ